MDVSGWVRGLATCDFLLPLAGARFLAAFLGRFFFAPFVFAVMPPPFLPVITSLSLERIYPAGFKMTGKYIKKAGDCKGFKSGI